MLGNLKKYLTEPQYANSMFSRLYSVTIDMTDKTFAQAFVRLDKKYPFLMTGISGFVYFKNYPDAYVDPYFAPRFTIINNDNGNKLNGGDARREKSDVQTIRFEQLSPYTHGSYIGGGRVNAELREIFPLKQFFNNNGLLGIEMWRQTPIPFPPYNGQMVAELTFWGYNINNENNEV